MEATTKAHDWSEQLRHLLALDSDSSVSKHDDGDDDGYAVVLLNHCFDSPSLGFKVNCADSLKLPKIRQFIRLWNGAAVRHAVDGGANYLFDLQQQLAKSNQPESSEFIPLANPHLLTGDMDSVRAEVLANYKATQTTRVIETPDQDDTDFTKAIQILRQNLEPQSQEQKKETVSTILVFYTGSGVRLDHGLSIFSTLYRFSEEVASGHLPPIVLVDLGSSISFLLTKGKHSIPAVRSASWCSLVPLGGPVRLVTSGFRWNLTAGDQLEFGRFISTSQEFDGQSAVATVEVLSDKGLLFSVEFG